ncbi:HI_0552 family protein, partial [Enterococcus faecalis]
MNLTHQDFNLFNREIFTFKQLKEQQTSAEIDDLKQTYKQHW